MTPDKSLRALFNEALERDDPGERARFLDEVCGADAVLRGRVEKLLRAHEEAGGFFSEPSKVPPSAHATGTIALPLTEKPGDKIGRYKVLQLIGEGGCGVVYMAEQQEPVRRRVALKVIKPGMDTKQVIARFEAERQALALMDHPNIAKVLDAGATETGRPYFVMELVRGTRITEFCDENKLSTEDRLELFIQVCQAVQHAHQKGVIHRDIKPSNILVTINDPDASGCPKVIDFGIAKATAGRLTDQTLFTAFEQFIGTPAYMSPEQAMMTSVDIDTRSDIYSLGVLLYELLTSRTPFDQKELLAAGLDETRRIIQEDKPPRPSTRLSTMAADSLTTAARDRQTDAPTLLHLVRGDLDWIVMKCLEKDRARRYATANGLARDIERHLNCEPVIARPPSRLYEFQKTVRRHKVEFAAAGAVIIALAIGLGISMWTLAKERRTRERAVAAERETERQLYTALLEQAHARVQSRELGQRVRTLDAIRRAAAISNSAELRREAFAALALPDLRFKHQMTTHQDVVELDPRFEQIALGHGEGPVEIRATADQRLIATLPASTNRVALSAEWSRDSRFLAVTAEDDRRNLGCGQRPAHLVAQRLICTDRSHSIQHNHAFYQFAARSEVTIRDLERDLEMNHFKVGGEPLDLQFSDDGDRFAVVYENKNAGFWSIDVHDTEAGRVQSSLRFDYGVKTFDWHPRGRWIAVPDNLGDVHLADIKTGETRVLGRHKSQAVSAIFSPDGDFLFSGGAENELFCWDLRSMQRAFIIGLQSSRLQFRRDGLECAVLTKTEVQWHAFERTSTCREFDAAALTRLYHGTFSPDGRWLVVTGRRQVGMWDWTRETVPALQSGPQFPSIPFFTPDNSKLFVYWSDGIACWDLIPGIGDGRPVQLGPRPVNKTRHLYSAFVCSDDLVLTGPGGMDFLALTNTAGTSRFFSTPNGLGCVSPDHRYVALRYLSRLWVRVFRTPDMTSVGEIHTGSEVVNFAFTPRGDELAIATRNGVDFYDSIAWQRTRSLPMRMDTYANFIFAPDGETVWISNDARSAALYRVRDLKILLPLPVNTLPLAISPDARYLAVSVESRRLQLWDLEEVRKQLRDLGLDWVSDPVARTVRR